VKAILHEWILALKPKRATTVGWLLCIHVLLLARDLLSNDGVIFISIDDNEQANLKLLCDDVFGEENFVAIENNPGRKNSDFISVRSEYLHFSAKQKYIVHYAKNIPKNSNDWQDK
jgi:adenine-specific DNA-methyltransferase